MHNVVYNALSAQRIGQNIYDSVLLGHVPPIGESEFIAAGQSTGVDGKRRIGAGNKNVPTALFRPDD